MKEVNKSVILINLVLVVFSACAPDKKEGNKTANGVDYGILKKVDWLVGKWENRSPEGYAAEVWEKQNDSTYQGISYFVAGKDTVSSEKITLVQSGKDLFYVPVVKDQNNGQPVSFKMTSQTAEQLVFENPEHDFPQKITYMRITGDSLMAEISGMLDGKPSSQKFPMVRAR